MPQPFDQLPQSVLRLSRLERVGANVPALIVHPHWDAAQQRATASAPVLVWMHGRTVNKELDSGRYLRLARAGIASCALDLPGHGERADLNLQGPASAMRVIEQMVRELDAVADDLAARDEFAGQRMALGGMSAGGMAALVRLTRAHRFDAALVESATGNFHEHGLRGLADPELIARMDPVRNLDGWRDIPLLGLHSKLDEWVPIEGQRTFFRAVRERSGRPDLVVLHEFERTGAPYEHSGFGRESAAAKELGTQFLAVHLHAAAPQPGESGERL
ncbi:MAG: alpha/beta fold hydrolase [Phycisphaerae bacterium]|nr:alpha/beta fold hydrolase [Phycisphaerae bacterium]